jgi:ribonuclease D
LAAIVSFGILEPVAEFASVQYDYLSSAEELRAFCDSVADAPAIFFDTEFVSEDTYRPELCLVQVKASDRLAVIDPYTVGSVAPFWQLITEGDHATVVHAGREEFRFCWFQTQKRPLNLFDVQIAAGLIGLEYPISYRKLISKLLGERLPKGETRTNWRQRPLTDKQIDYALLDVHHLPTLRDALTAELERLGRMEWFRDEMETWQSELIASESREKWRRVSGISGLSNRALVIVRELWIWREEEARQSNRPPRRVLRDDLIVELARRGKADLRQIKAIRGIERSGAKRHFEDIAKSVERALELPHEKWPRTSKSSVPNQVTVLGQFLATALTSICRSNQLAPSVVGTAQDVRDLVAFELGFHDASEEIPRLARGWRKEVIGQSLSELLQGKRAIRIDDPLSDHPLRFDDVDEGPGV